MLAIAALLALAGLASATTYVALELEEIVAAAEIAFLGEVRDVSVIERDGLPWTRVTFEVQRDLLADGGIGREPADGTDPGEIELAFLGGTLPGGPSLTVALMPSFRVGDRVVALAYDDAQLASPIVGFLQGLWRVDGESLVDPAGRSLGLAEGSLSPGGPAAPLDAVLDALAERLGGGP